MQRPMSSALLAIAQLAPPCDELPEDYQSQMRVLDSERRKYQAGEIRSRGVCGGQSTPRWGTGIVLGSSLMWPNFLLNWLCSRDEEFS